jgi:hypothetical protein
MERRRLQAACLKRVWADPWAPVCERHGTLLSDRTERVVQALQRLSNEALEGAHEALQAALTEREHTLSAAEQGAGDRQIPAH